MMAEISDAGDDWEKVLAHVREELARWGIDRFDVGAMAHRYGIDVDELRRRWHDPDSLILEALSQRPGDVDLPPDTGSLRSDLIDLATRMAAMVTTADGRKLHGGHLIGDLHVASMDIRRSAWRTRAGGLKVVFERARGRGEMRPGVDHFTALELLFAPINMRALYTGEPVDAAYCETVADLVYRAVSVP